MISIEIRIDVPELAQGVRFCADAFGRPCIWIFMSRI